MTMLEFITASSFYFATILFVIFLIHFGFFIFSEKYYSHIMRPNHSCNEYFYSVANRAAIPLCILPFLFFFISFICWICINDSFERFYAEKAYEEAQVYVDSNKIVSNPYMIGDIRYEAFKVALNKKPLNVDEIHVRLWK